MKTILSAVQPSSAPTLGNYLGAMKGWVEWQSTYDCYFFAVDLHAITVPQDPKTLRHNTYLALSTYLATGIDPSVSTVFVQSHVPQHAELAWILTCFASMGELGKMTQFKDKTDKVSEGEPIGVGLFSYPILMAADILLYGADVVPAGEDQFQHIQLARDLARRANHRLGRPLFTMPEPLIPKVGARIMSLQEPTRKMSKSDPVASATIFLTDSDTLLSKKIRRAVTDGGSEVSPEDLTPGVRNLLQIHAACQGGSVESSAQAFAGKSYGYLKSQVAEVVVAEIRPIRNRIETLMSDLPAMDTLLAYGADRAREKAAAKLREVYEVLGFLPGKSL